MGRPVRRFEDDRLLRGRAMYIEDMSRPGLAYIILVRSPYAHARISDLDLGAARALPGVVAVVSAEDLPPLKSIPAALPGGRPVPEHPALARGIVRFAGEPVVAVVAERPELAMDAATAVAINYEPLPAIVD
ncbi:MAG: xanthine dehydrogenase family protein molybdopterin-binding subunit, partial [Chloroflexi bacterium]|nr:xanthine dehydrogenase family protein molybdopterin-binding subunit [Chloroflexota bacterium]